MINELQLPPVHPLLKAIDGLRSEAQILSPEAALHVGLLPTDHLDPNEGDDQGQQQQVPQGLIHDGHAHIHNVKDTYMGLRVKTNGPVRTSALLGRSGRRFV